jgi:hypothetical protein
MIKPQGRDQPATDPAGMRHYRPEPYGTLRPKVPTEMCGTTSKLGEPYALDALSQALAPQHHHAQAEEHLRLGALGV